MVDDAQLQFDDFQVLLLPPRLETEVAHRRHSRHSPPLCALRDHSLIWRLLWARKRGGGETPSGDKILSIVGRGRGQMSYEGSPWVRRWAHSLQKRRLASSHVLGPIIRRVAYFLRNLAILPDSYGTTPHMTSTVWIFWITCKYLCTRIAFVLNSPHLLLMSYVIGPFFLFLFFLFGRSRITPCPLPTNFRFGHADGHFTIVGWLVLLLVFRTTSDFVGFDSRCCEGSVCVISLSLHG